MTSTIVAEEVPPLCHPFGPRNKLVFSSGITTETALPTSARISAGGTSPLTGGITESNAGSSWGPALARLGIRALVVEGKPEDKAYKGVSISWDEEKQAPNVELFDAGEYAKRDLYEERCLMLFSDPLS